MNKKLFLYPASLVFAIAIISNLHISDQDQVTQKKHTPEQQSIAQKVKIIQHPPVSVDPLVNRSYSDKPTSAQQNEQTDHLANPVIKAPLKPFVVDCEFCLKVTSDLNDMITQTCRINNTIQDINSSAMFSFLLAIASLNDKMYQDFVATARNTIDCNDENTWIENTRTMYKLYYL